ncbi:hypothetical protein DI458_03320 [Burkholderia contaminans]|nr:hypothetical protein [Burkholderia contaminans]MBA9840836.1 hypothetical protein [Burkholderia contaminans]MBA9866141.1 hypothetical protein [Burkholderia contaminans]MBA9907816.1 hypothetical protein [Burkholderia contaminans]MBA9931531.1 hypothetical protein [Burkholderia contaminans]
MCASGNRVDAHVQVALCDCCRARDAAARLPAGAPKRGSATGPSHHAAAHRAAAATNRPNGRRRHVPFDFDRPCA